MMNKLLKWNAEFAKNIWLEYSVQRMIAMPAIILLIIVLIFVNSGSGIDAFETLKTASLGGFIFIGMLWGIKSASNSILDEYNDKTWDWQKMTIIGAWKLVIGKLFGSTIYNWYGGLICLLIYLFASLRLGSFSEALRDSFLLIVSMISLHGVIILMALQLIKKADGRAKVKSNRIFIAAFLFLSFLSNIFGFSIFHYTDFNPVISWFGIPLTLTTASIVSSLFYCVWIVAGLYRSMRAELQYSDVPTWWLWFIVTNFLFQTGFLIGYESFSVSTSLLIAVFVYFTELLFIVYFLAITESKDIVNFRTLQNAFVQKKWQIFFQNIPLWLLTLPIAFAFGLLAVFLFMIVGHADIDEQLQSLDINGTMIAIAFLVSLFLFIIRDLSVLLILHFSPKAKRANTAMFFYMLLMYIILPMLLSGAQNLGAAFYPTPKASVLLMVIFPLAEAGIALFFLVKKWNALSHDIH